MICWILFDILQEEVDLDKKQNSKPKKTPPEIWEWLLLLCCSVVVYFEGKQDAVRSLGRNIFFRTVMPLAFAREKVFGFSHFFST